MEVLRYHVEKVFYPENGEYLDNPASASDAEIESSQNDRINIKYKKTFFSYPHKNLF